MQPVVLLILAVVWAVFLVPQIVRARAEKTPSDSIGAFRNQLSVLQRSAPGSPAPLSSMGPTYGAYRPAVSPRELVRRRRQSILFGLLVGMGLTLLLGLLVPKVLVLHAALDAIFVAYCALLVRARNLATERQSKVRYLPGAVITPEPQFLLRHSGG